MSASATSVLKHCSQQVERWVLQQAVPPKLSFVHAKWKISAVDQKDFNKLLLRKGGCIVCKHNNQLVHAWTAHVIALKAEATVLLHVIKWAQARNVQNVFLFCKHVQSMPCFHVFPGNHIRVQTSLNAANKQMLYTAIAARRLIGCLLATCILEYADAYADILDMQRSNTVVLWDNRVWATSEL